MERVAPRPWIRSRGGPVPTRSYAIPAARAVSAVCNDLELATEITDVGNVSLDHNSVGAGCSTAWDVNAHRRPRPARVGDVADLDDRPVRQIDGHELAVDLAIDLVAGAVSELLVGVVDDAGLDGGAGPGLSGLDGDAEAAGSACRGGAGGGGGVGVATTRGQEQTAGSRQQAATRSGDGASESGWAADGFIMAGMSRFIPLLALLAAMLLAPTSVGATENPAHQPPFGDEPLAPLERVSDLETVPPGFTLTALEALEFADAAPEVIDERAESPEMVPRISTRGDDRWQIDYFQDGTAVAQAVIGDRDGDVIEAWRNQQVEVKLARGYEDAVAGNANEWYVWIPLCLMFVAPFFDPRRPFRLLHLDLLVLVSFSISQFFFNRGDIVLSVPLVYPVLAYLFVRMLMAGFRPRRREGPLIPLLPMRWLVVAAIVLAIFRVGLNVADSQVIDIGFANVVGADRIADGEGVYDGQFTPLIDRGDSYGPVSYLSYVPFEQVLPWDGGLEPLEAAHAAAIVFDLAVVGLLLIVGRRLREGTEGRDLGVALAFAWLAYPYTLYALDANGGNDALVAALLIAALIAVASPLRRGLAIGIGAATKFGPLALAPLFAAGPGERRLRSTVLFAAAFLAVWAVVLVPLLPEGGLREFYDRTFGYQASRGSPFSIWGLAPSLEPLQTLARIFPVLLGAALFFVPSRRSSLQIAALGAAVLIATQVGSEHWFYFFILWWLPYVLINSFASQERISGVREPAGPKTAPRPDVDLAAARSS